jgi:hypothetical protein
LRPTPILEDHVPTFISPKDRVAQLYPQASGSFFVAFYDSQVKDGSILTNLHTRNDFINNILISGHTAKDLNCPTTLSKKSSISNFGKIFLTIFEIHGKFPYGHM